MEYLAGGTVADALRVDSVRRVHAVKWVRRGRLRARFRPQPRRSASRHQARQPAARSRPGPARGRLRHRPARHRGHDHRRPARCSAPPPISRPSARSASPPPTPATATRSRWRPSSCWSASGRSPPPTSPPRPASTSTTSLRPRASATARCRRRSTRFWPAAWPSARSDRWPTAQDFAQALDGGAHRGGHDDGPTRAVAAAAAASPARRLAVDGQPAARAGPRVRRPRTASAAGRRRRPRRRARPDPGPGRAGRRSVPRRSRSRGHARQRRRHIRPASSRAAQRPAAEGHPQPGGAAQAEPAKPHSDQTSTVTATAGRRDHAAPDRRHARGARPPADGRRQLRRRDPGAPPGRRRRRRPTSLTYAYALYDLGRSLRLAGDPKDAVTVLYQRLQIPNQTPEVRQQLQLALLALGQAANGGGAATGARRTARPSSRPRRPWERTAPAADRAPEPRPGPGRRLPGRLATAYARRPFRGRSASSRPASSSLTASEASAASAACAPGVALGAAGHALERLLHRVDRQHAEPARHAGLELHLLDPASGLAAHVVVVVGLAADHRAEADDRA